MHCILNARGGLEQVAADVLNARKLRIIAESVAKCDAIDGRVLNQLSRSNLALPTCLRCASTCGAQRPGADGSSTA